MADKDLGITVTGDISDIEAQLNNLTSLIEGIPDRVVNITAEVDSTQIDEFVNDINNLAETVSETSDEISGSLDTATESIGNMGDAANTTSTEITDTMTTAADSISSVGDSAIETGSDISSGLSDVSGLFGEVSAAAEETSNSINSIDSTAINEAASAASALGTDLSQSSEQTKEYSANVKEASESTSLLGGAMEALVGIGIVAFIGEASEAAGSFEDSWARLDLAIGGTAEGIEATQEEWSESINIMKEETGRSAGIIREYLIQMGIAGVDAADVLEDSFSAISGAAYVSGRSIEEVEAAFKRVVMTGILGKKQIVALGLSEQDVMKATGLSIDGVNEKLKGMDSNARAAFLAMIIGAKYGTDANEEYKKSWQHVLDAMKAAMGYMMVAFGELFLPILRPVIDTATALLKGFADFIRGLPEPVKVFLGLLVSLAGGFVFVSTVLNPLISLLTPLVSSLMPRLVGVFYTFTDALILTGSLTGALTATLGPVGIAISVIVLAVTAAITAWTLWSDEIIKFKELILSGDWGGAAQMIVDAFVWAFTEVYNFIISIPAKIGEKAGAFIETGKNIVRWIYDGLKSLASKLDKWIADDFKKVGAGAGTGMLSGFDKWIRDNGPKIVEIVDTVLFRILPKLMEIAAKLVLLVGKHILDTFWQWATRDLWVGAYNAGAGWIDNLIRGIQDGIPTFDDVLEWLRDRLPHSPPKTGPLAEVTDASMYNWASDIAEAGNLGLAKLDLRGIGFDLWTTQKITSGVNNNVQQNYNITVDTTGMGGVSSDEAQNIGQNIGAGIKNTLEKDTIHAGIWTVNSIR